MLCAVDGIDGCVQDFQTPEAATQAPSHKTLICGPYSVLPHVDVLYGGSVAQPDNGVRRGQDALPSVACNLQGVVARLDLSPGVLYHPGRRLAGKGPKVE